MKRMCVWAMCAAGLLAADASRAEAQGMGAFRGYLSGQAGMATGGDASNPVFTPGLVMSVQEQDGWGAEFDFGYSSDLEAGAQVLDVASYMFSINFIQPRGRLRPFVGAGLGVMQVDGCNAPCTRPAKTYDAGLTASGGVLLTLNDLFAVRGDARYLRTLADHPDLNRPSNFSFWRVSMGLTFSWAILP